MNKWNLKLKTQYLFIFPGGSDGKESACNAGDLGLIPGSERSPRGGHGNPLQYSCLENLQGQRSLLGYSPWGYKELDMTKQLHTFILASLKMKYLSINLIKSAVLFYL